MAKKPTPQDQTQWEKAVANRFGDVSLEQIASIKKRVDMFSAELDRLTKRMNTLGMSTIPHVDGHTKIEAALKTIQRVQINMTEALIRASVD